MREIKFRAWDKEDRVMRSWDEVILEKEQGNKYYLLGYKLNKAITEYDHEHVLMQYTGLKDKNGVEIYEGDLVAVADYANWEGLYKIIWDEKNLMYMLEDAFGDREKLCEFEEYLVKGNIYENPEILKE